MKVVTCEKEYCPENITLSWWSYHKKVIPPGTPIIWTDVNATELTAGVQDLGQYTVDEFQYANWKYPDNPGDSLVIIAPGGIGDIITICPLLREIKLRFPSLNAALCCTSHGIQAARAFLGNNIGYIEYPPRYGTVKMFSSVIVYEHIAAQADFYNLTLQDFWASVCNIEKLKSPLIAPQFNWLAAKSIQSFLPIKDKKWVGIQLRSSSEVRTYPPGLLTLYVGPMLAQLGYQIFFTGNLYDFGGYFKRKCQKCARIVKYENDTYKCTYCGNSDLKFMEKIKINPEEFGIIDLCGKLETIEEVIEFYRMCDAIITPDSVALHIGGMLQIPTIALFGSIPHYVRTSCYPTVSALQGTASCSPCYNVGTYMECGNKYCKALTNISPYDIIDMVTKILPTGR